MTTPIRPNQPGIHVHEQTDGPVYSDLPALGLTAEPGFDRPRLHIEGALEAKNLRPFYTTLTAPFLMVPSRRVVVNDSPYINGTEILQVFREEGDTVVVDGVNLPWANGTPIWYAYDDGTGLSNWFPATVSEVIPLEVAELTVWPEFSNPQLVRPDVLEPQGLAPRSPPSVGNPGALVTINVLPHNLSTQPKFSAPFLALPGSEGKKVEPVQPLYDGETGFTQNPFTGPYLTGMKMTITSTDSDWLLDQASIRFATIAGNKHAPKFSTDRESNVVYFSDYQQDPFGRWDEIKAAITNGQTVKWRLGGFTDKVDYVEPRPLLNATVFFDYVIDASQYAFVPGTDGANERGYQRDQFGALVPGSFGGFAVYNLRAASDDSVWVSLGDTGEDRFSGGYDSITLDIEGFTGGLITLLWDEANTQYSGASAGVFSYLDAEQGNTLDLDMRPVQVPVLPIQVGTLRPISAPQLSPPQLYPLTVLESANLTAQPNLAPPEMYVWQDIAVNNLTSAPTISEPQLDLQVAGTFPTEPKLSSISLGTEMLVQDEGAFSSWVEFNSPDLGNRNLTLTNSDSGIYFPRASRNFSPWWQPVEMDVSLEYVGAEVQQIRFAFLSPDGTGGENAANAGFRMRLYSNGRFDVEAKHNGGAWFQNMSGAERTPVGRIKATFDRPSGNSNSITYDVTTYQINGTTVIANYTGTLQAASGVNLDYEQWDAGADYLAPGSVQGLLYIAAGTLNPGNRWTITDLQLHNRIQAGTHGTKWGPVPDGIMFELPDLDHAVQTSLARDRLIRPELAPFNASGVTDSTNALRDAINTARDWGCGVYLDGGGEVLITDEIVSKQYCYQRANNRQHYTDEFLPTYLKASTANPRTIRLADGSSGYETGTNKGTAKAALRFVAYDYRQDPPSGEAKNSHYNSVAEGLKFDLGNNPGAYAIQNWGAQGVNIFGLEVTGTNYFAAGVDAPGSGGSVYGVKATGTRKYSWVIDGCQPNVCLKGFECDDGATEAQFYFYSGPDGTGNRGTTVVVGGKFTCAPGTVFVDARDVGTSTDRGLFEIHGAQVEWTSADLGNVFAAGKKTVILEDCYVRNCADLLVSDAAGITDIPSPDPNGWVYVEYAYIPVNPGTVSVSGIQLASPNDITSPYPLTSDYVLNGVSNGGQAHSAAASSAPSAGWNDLHNFTPAPDLDAGQFKDISLLGSTEPDGYTDNTAAINTAIAGAVAGDVFYFKPGLWIVNTPISIPSQNCTFLGGGVVFTFVAPEREPGVDDPYGSNSSYSPLISGTNNATVENNIINLSPWTPPEVPKAYAFNIRGKCQFQGSRGYRSSYWGYAGWSGAPPAVDHNFENIRFTGNANGEFNGMTASNGYNATSGYRQFRFDACSGDMRFYHANVEHVKEFPGNIRVDGLTGSITMYGVKCESNMPIVYATSSTGAMRFHGVGGNFSGLIPTAYFNAMFTDEGNWADATAYQEHDWVTNDQGQNYPYYVCIADHTASAATQPGVGASWDTVWAWFPDKGLTPASLAPGGYPGSQNPPAMFVFEDCDDYEVSAAIETPTRINGYHATFGNGTRPDKWHLINEIQSGVSLITTDPGERPAMFKRDSWVVPPTGTHQYTIGDNGSAAAGFRSGQYGAIDPGTLDGVTIFEFFTNTGTGLYQLKMGTGSEQIPGINSVEVEFEGYTANPVVMPWAAGAGNYRKTGDTALAAWIMARSGTTINITMTTVA